MNKVIIENKNNINLIKKDININEGKYIGEFKNRMRDRKGTMYFNNDDKYEGEFRNDKREGKGIIYYNDGDRYEGDWRNDKVVL